MMASKGNMLYFSALQNPMDWTSTENSREDRVPNCNQITGLVSFDDKLIVFSQKTCIYIMVQMLWQEKQILTLVSH